MPLLDSVNQAVTVAQSPTHSSAFMVVSDERLLDTEKQCPELPLGGPGPLFTPGPALGTTNDLGATRAEPTVRPALSKALRIGTTARSPASQKRRDAREVGRIRQI